MDDMDDDTGDDFMMRSQDVYQNRPPPPDGRYVEIVEQPQARGFRFRYACEGKSHGGLQGINSRKEKKTYPSVKINGYKGPARIEVTLVTDEKEPKPHAHELIGKNCADGKCVTNIKGDSMSVSFPNLGVRHVTKKSVLEILTKRYEEMFKLEKCRQSNLGYITELERVPLTPEEKCHAQQLALEQSRTIQLSIARLCITVYLQNNNGQLIGLLPRVISKPIFDSKAPCTSLLKICRMDKVGGCCTGNEEVFLLCDKVQKDDIAVRFFEQDEEGILKWEDFGHFAPHDVHRQYAIVFRTPAYCDKTIEKPVVVHVQLKRNNDNEVSDPKTFTYYPQQTDLEDIQKKRRKQIPNFSDEHVFPTANGQMSYSNGTHNNTPFRSMQPFGNSGNYAHMREVSHQNVRNSAYSTINPADMDVVMSHDVKNFNHPMIPYPVLELTSDSTCSGFDPSFIQPSQAQRPPKRSSDLISRGGCVPRSCVPSKPKAVGTVEPSASVKPSIDRPATKSEKDVIKTEQSTPSESTEVSAKVSTSVTGSAPADERVQTESVTVKKEISTSSENQETKSEKESSNAKISAKIEDPSDVMSQMKIDSAVQNKKLVSLQTIASVFACALHGYAMTGDVKHLIYPSRRLIDNQNEDGDNAIHLAVIHTQALALYNFVAVLAALPVAEAINDTNFLRQTPLYLSVITQQEELVDILLKCGADCFILDKHGNTLIHIAAKSGYETCLKKLLNRWLNLSDTQTWHPCIDSLNYEGLGALHLAVRHEHFGCTQLLLDVGGADINLKDGSSGRTALHHAVDIGSLTIVADLITRPGIDVNAARYDGNTAFHLAVSQNKQQIASVLVAAGANTEAVNFEEIESDESGEDDYDVDDDDDDDDNDIDVDGECDVTRHKKTKGLAPKDLAGSDAKMLSILNREDLSVFDCSALMSKMSMIEGLDEKCDSGIESIRGHSVPVTRSGLTEGSIPSSSLETETKIELTPDVRKLDASTRVRLAKLLDPVKSGCDWRNLAARLGLESLTDAVKNSRSPTQDVLNHFEINGGTLGGLREALVQINRTDAVDLLDKNIS